MDDDNVKRRDYFTNLKYGDLVRTQSGRALAFIAYVKEATPGSQLILLDRHTREVETFHDDGRYMLNRTHSNWDLVVPTKD
jgi:hypothetical protein